MYTFVLSHLFLLKHLFAVQFILCSFHNPYHFSQLFDTIIIHNIAFQYVLFQYGISPTAEFYTTFGFYTITNGDDYIKAIIFNISFYFSFPLNLNCRKFCDS